MLNTLHLQTFIGGAWRDAADVDLTGDIRRGVQASTRLTYVPSYVLEYMGRIDAAALSITAPVDFSSDGFDTWPAFLVDLLPQGYGRLELLKQLERNELAESAADWELLCAGAGNPIGNLRVKEAHEWVMARSGDVSKGFTTEEVGARASDFNEYLAQHGLFLAGSSGVQGEWPKILLTRADDDLLYLDHMLPDAKATEHFIVKFGRGKDQALENILQLEAPYMQLAKLLGLRVKRELTLIERALFIPRFDREVVSGGVVRHGQESIAAFCELPGFGVVPSHNEVCRRLGKYATDPVAEVIEYIKRDIANIALGNKDNHARNTAIQRKCDGSVSLTPLFDFAPMWLHPDGIARRMRWEKDDGGTPTWSSVIAQAADTSGIDAQVLAEGVREMCEPLSTIYAAGIALGIDEGAFLKPLEKTIANVRAQMEAL